MKKFINRITFKTISFIWLLGIISSCGSYHTIASASSEIQAKISKEMTPDNTVFLAHSGDSTYQLSNPQIRSGKLTANVVPLNQSELEFYKMINARHAKNKNIKTFRGKKDKGNDTSDFTDTIQKSSLTPNEMNSLHQTSHYQVNIHTNRLDEEDGRLSIDLKDVTKTQVLNDTSTSPVIIFVTVVLAALLIIIVILAIIALACGCPHIYLQNGDAFEYTNTLFTGALSNKLERFDYKELKDFNPNKSSLLLQIKNEENEEQFINLLGLKVAYHDASFRVLTDQQGKLYSIKNAVAPKKAIDNAGHSLYTTLQEEDGSAFQFNTQSKTGISSGDLNFERPKSSNHAKLLLSLRNSAWAGLVHQEFNAALGSKQAEFIEANNRKNKEELLKDLKKAGIPLVIYIKSKNRWIELETIQPVGNANMQTLVVPIDEKYMTNPDIEIRVSCGFKFWELDYAAMDFSAPIPFEVQYLSPSHVGGDLTNLSALKNDDQSYVTTRVASDPISIQFNGLQEKNRTLFLESKGYYVRQKREEGKPQWGLLANLKRSNGLGRFSQELFLNYMQDFGKLSVR